MRRGIILSVLAFTLGVLAMSDVAVEDATAQDKKRPSPTADESYTEKVSVRRFVNGKLLSEKSAAKNVPAFRWEEKGELKFYTKAKAAATPTTGSEVTDEKGNVFVVGKVVNNAGSGYHISTVKPKPKE